MTSQSLPATARSIGSIFPGALHLFALSSFFIAQPLFSLLANNAEFFIARAASPVDIIIFVLAATCLPALMLIPVLLFSSLFGERALRAALLILISLLVALGTLSGLNKRGLPGGGVSMLLVAMLLGVLFAWMYSRLQTLQSLLTYVSFAALIFPVAFLLTPDIRDILAPPQSIAAAKSLPAGSDIPIVLVVFDEFNSTSLMTQEHLVDPDLYPNFAWLAERSHWFRNASSVASGTVAAVPAIFSGHYAHGGQPSLRDYPVNLFTVLGDAYTYNVYESASKLCPPQRCPVLIKVPLFQRITSLFVDVAIVYLHLVTPKEFAAHLPDISQGWNNFLVAGGEDNPGEPFAEGWRDFVESSLRNDREAIWRRFIAAIPADGPSLNVLHSLLPHVPLEFLPSGKKYGTHKKVGIKNEKWQSDGWAVHQAWQRHLMQLVHADRLLGELFAELQRKGLFEDALIIVTADHGVSFKVGGFRRQLSTDNFMDILPVPLFVKLPGQQNGTVSDDNIETVDILPTIIDILGMDPLPTTEGFSVFDADGRGARASKRMWDKKLNKTLEFSGNLEERYDTVTERLGLFGNIAGPDRLFYMGPYKHLIGRDASSLPLAKGNQGVALLGSNYRSNANWVTGTVTGITPDDNSKWQLALAVNGVIRSVTQTFDPAGNGYREFTFLVPETAYTGTDDEIDIWIGSDQGWSLLERTIYAMLEENDGERAIVDDEGVRYPIIPGSVRGRVDRLIIDDGAVQARGWAVDTANDKPVKAVLLFRNGNFISSTSPSVRRRDVAKLFGRDSLITGFDISGTDDSRWPSAGEYSFFGLTTDGLAGKLRYEGPTID